MKAESSSASIPPEEASRLQENLPASIPASIEYDMWMIGAIMYFLLTGNKLFPTKTEDSDSIHPDAMAALVGWKNLPESVASTVLLECDDPTINSEREQAFNILRQLLAGNPKKRPKSVADVLNHPFFTEFRLIQDAVSKRQATLGFALSTLAEHMREYASKLVGRFLDKCRQEVSGYPADAAMRAWKEVVEALSHRRPKWHEINGNETRDAPLECKVCHTKIGGPPEPPQAGEEVIVVRLSQGEKECRGTLTMRNPPSEDKILHELRETVPKMPEGKEKNKAMKKLAAKEASAMANCRAILCDAKQGYWDAVVEFVNPHNGEEDERPMLVQVLSAATDEENAPQRVAPAALRENLEALLTAKLLTAEQMQGMLATMNCNHDLKSMACTYEAPPTRKQMSAMWERVSLMPNDTEEEKSAKEAAKQAT